MSVAIVKGVTPTGLVVNLAVTEEGLLRVSGGGTGGGGGIGGDASAENQTIEIARLEAIRDKLPLVNGRLAIDGSSVTQPVNGTVNVGNLPTTQQVAWDNPLPVSGNVLVANFPTTQAIAGNVAVVNFPSSQPISGNVGVNNFPTTFAVSNFPTTQPVSGTVSIGNFPATQPISGTVSVGNFPSSQPISATALPLPTGAATETTLGAINARIGAPSDASATNDFGSFSLIALFKRLLTKLPSALSSDRLKVESTILATSKTTNFINTSTAGTIAAGSNAVAIANVGNAAGTVKGVSLPAGASINWSGNSGDVLDAIAYSATGTTFLITTITPVLDA